MTKRRGAHPILVVGGIVAIVIALLIFTPAILGATSSGNNVEKYNGTSQAGNDTARIAGGVNTFFVGITGIPLTLAAFATALFAFIVIILWILKRNRK